MEDVPGSGRYQRADPFLSTARQVHFGGSGGGGRQFRVDPDSVRNDADGIIAAVLPGDRGGSGGGNSNAPLSLRIRFYSNGVCRVKLDEPPPAPQRWEVRRRTPPLVDLVQTLTCNPFRFAPTFLGTKYLELV